MADAILVLNAGSSSLKFSAFDAGGHGFPLMFSGQVEGLYTAAKFKAKDAHGAEIGAKAWGNDAGVGHGEALAYLVDFLQARSGNDKLVAVGHRVVHGGVAYDQAVRVDRSLIAALAKLSPLAPLHQPHNLKPIEIVAKLRPNLPQVACFDTAFHRVQPEVAQAFALPASITEMGVRRYGFHGLSYEYIASVLPGIDAKAAAGRTVVAHLGNGSSMCAMVAGRSASPSAARPPR